MKIRLCSTPDVPGGGVIRVETNGLAVAVFNLNGEFYVTDDACTHEPGSMSEGWVDGDCVECNFHQGVFNIKTGAVVQPPAMEPLKTYPASVEQGDVYIEHNVSAQPLL
ncbi:MAG TPA: non-heme iron oxygenase ferredoxin subunit [Vicinamibacterales bacterium]